MTQYEIFELKYDISTPGEPSACPDVSADFAVKTVHRLMVISMKNRCKTHHLVVLRRFYITIIFFVHMAAARIPTDDHMVLPQREPEYIPLHHGSP